MLLLRGNGHKENTLSESVLIFGNGITLDTFSERYASLVESRERVEFQVSQTRTEVDELLSKKFYPDFTSRLQSGLKISDIGSIVQSEIVRVADSDPFSKNLWDNIAVFNSLCDYIYKLFWLYNRAIERLDTNNKAIDKFSEALKKNNYKPIIINLNYDLVVERHLGKYNKISYFGFTEEQNSIELFKPHGSINFMSNVNDPEESGFVSSNPFYPITNNDAIPRNVKNPLWFRNISNGKHLGSLVYKEVPMYSVEIVPPGCSNRIPRKYSDVGESEYILPWAFSIYQEIFEKLKCRKNLVIAGISFGHEDQWELAQYVNTFMSENSSGLVYILYFSLSDKENIDKFIEKYKINWARIELFLGTFTEKYEEILNVL